MADPAAAGASVVGSAAVASPTTGRRLLEDPDIDVLYLAVPHDLHEQLYLDAIAAGKDFLGEKPFGIDLAAGRADRGGGRGIAAFVRVLQRAAVLPRRPAGRRRWSAAALLGELIEVRTGSCTPRTSTAPSRSTGSARPRSAASIGVMGDLGMHAAHVPLRLGWRPATRSTRCSTTSCATAPARTASRCPATPGTTPCCPDRRDAGRRFPLTLWETKRIAPARCNTWCFEALGMDGGVEFSTASPQVFKRFAVRDGEQAWAHIQPGHQSALADRDRRHLRVRLPRRDAADVGGLPRRARRCARRPVRTATPQEAFAAHRVFAAALRSHETGRSERVAG